MGGEQFCGIRMQFPLGLLTFGDRNVHIPNVFDGLISQMSIFLMFLIDLFRKCQYSLWFLHIFYAWVLHIGLGSALGSALECSGVLWKVLEISEASGF